MLKKGSLALVVCMIGSIMLSGPARASAVGTWSVTLIETVTVTVLNTTQTVTVTERDRFVFKPSRVLLIDGVAVGKWRQMGRTIVCTLNRTAIANWAEQGFASLGYNANVSITNASLRGRESLDKKRIRGQMNLDMSVYFPDYARTATARMSGSVRGRRVTPLSSMSTQPALPQNDSQGPTAEDIGTTLLDSLFQRK